MKRIGYMPMLAGDATDFYRCTGVLEYIKDPQIDFKRLRDIMSIDWQDIAGLDILIVQRPLNEAGLRLIDIAKGMNIKVILDYDDDVFNIPSHNPSYEYYKDNEEIIKQCLELSDEVWVSTLQIKRSIEATRLNNNIHVIPNAHNDFIFPVELKKPLDKENKLAVYRGGATHNEDVYAIQDELVEKINNSDWEFRFIGSRFPAIEVKTGNNHTYTHPMSMISYFNYLHQSNPSIVFFPLLTNKFNHAKSNICFLEATYAGAAFFSNKELYEYRRQNNMVFPISEFFKEPDMELLEMFNNTAWEYIKENLLLSKINQQRLERLLW